MTSPRFKHPAVAEAYAQAVAVYFSDPSISARYPFEEASDGSKTITVRGVGCYVRDPSDLAVRFEPAADIEPSQKPPRPPVMWPIPCADPGHPLDAVWADFQGIETAITQLKNNNAEGFSEKQFQASAFHAYTVNTKIRDKSRSITQFQFKTATALWWRHFVDRPTMALLARINGITHADCVSWTDYAAFSSRPDLDALRQQTERLGALSRFLIGLSPSDQIMGRLPEPVAFLANSLEFSGLAPSAKRLVVETFCQKMSGPHLDPIIKSIHDTWATFLDLAGPTQTTPSAQAAAFACAVRIREDNLPGHFEVLLERFALFTDVVEWDATATGGKRLPELARNSAGRHSLSRWFIRLNPDIFSPDGEPQGAYSLNDRPSLSASLDRVLLARAAMKSNKKERPRRL